MLIANTLIFSVFCYSAAALVTTVLPEGIAYRKTYRNPNYLSNHNETSDFTENIQLNQERENKPDLKVLIEQDKLSLTTPKYTKNVSNKSTLSHVTNTESPSSIPNSINSVKLPTPRRRQRIPHKERLQEKYFSSPNISQTRNLLELNNKSNNTKESFVQPRTFPKRPAEFNPVFKKRTRERDPVVKIVRERNNVYSHTGNFFYSFEGGDGTIVSSEGRLKSFEDKTAGEAVSGSIFYKDKDGNDISLTYTADENGYRPIGDHLPTPPPVPPEIARALAYLATKSTPQPITEAYNTK